MRRLVPRMDLDTITSALMVGACAVLLLVDMLAVSTDVLVRWLEGKSWAGLFEIAEYSLLWLAFLGMPWVTRKRMHVRVELLTGALRAPYRRILERVGAACALLTLGIVFCYTLAQTLVDLFTGSTLATVLVPPKWPIEVVIPFGFAVVILLELRALGRGQNGTEDRG